MARYISSQKKIIKKTSFPPINNYLQPRQWFTRPRAGKYFIRFSQAKINKKVVFSGVPNSKIDDLFARQKCFSSSKYLQKTITIFVIKIFIYGVSYLLKLSDTLLGAGKRNNYKNNNALKILKKATEINF